MTITSNRPGWSRISLYVPNDLLAAMDQVAPAEWAGRHAAKVGKGRSAFVRRAIRAELDRVTGGPGPVQLGGFLRAVGVTSDPREPEVTDNGQLPGS